MATGGDYYFQTWTNGSTTATTANFIWPQWNQLQNVAQQQIVWNQWLNSASNTAPPAYQLYQERVPTPEQERAIREQIRQATEQAAAAQREFMRQEEERRREYARINEIAETFLLEHLNDEERASWRKEKVVHIQTARDRRYRIAAGQQVRRVAAAAGGGDISYCIHPNMTLPEGDRVLAMVLLIKYDEQKFLDIANATDMHTGNRLPHERLDPRRDEPLAA